MDVTSLFIEWITWRQTSKITSKYEIKLDMYCKNAQQKHLKMELKGFKVYFKIKT